MTLFQGPTHEGSLCMHPPVTEEQTLHCTLCQLSDAASSARLMDECAAAESIPKLECLVLTSNKLNNLAVRICLVPADTTAVQLLASSLQRPSCR